MISIIIPIWNSGAFLDECLASIASQTENGWECLLIDDGSQDDSLVICHQWVERDSRFKVLQQDHLGVSAARNKGIKASQGEYIVFVDSDDSVSSKYLESLLTAEFADLVVGGCVKCYSGKNNRKYLCPSMNATFKVEPQYEAAFADLNEKFLLYGPCAKLYKANIIKFNQVQFPENRSIGEDIEFNYQYLRHVNVISCVTACEYYYQIRADRDSLSSKKRPDRFSSDIEQWRIIKHFFEDRAMLEKEMKQLVVKRLWEIVYDSLFIASHTEPNRLGYYKQVLGIPEIGLLAEHKNVYPCARWIKVLILSRSALFFYLYGRFSSKHI